MDASAMMSRLAKVFEVATFITLREGLIADMTEVWTDVNEVAPAGTRPA